MTLCNLTGSLNCVNGVCASICVMQRLTENYTKGYFADELLLALKCSVLEYGAKWKDELKLMLRSLHECSTDGRKAKMLANWEEKLAKLQRKQVRPELSMIEASEEESQPSGPAMDVDTVQTQSKQARHHDKAAGKCYNYFQYL